MNKVLHFFKGTAPIKLIAISILIAALSYFLEKSLPSLFLGLRLIAFLLFVYGAIRLLDRK